MIIFKFVAAGVGGEKPVFSVSGDVAGDVNVITESPARVTLKGCA